MANLETLKEQTLTGTPLLLFTCAFTDGSVRRWCEQKVMADGHEYEARVLGHSGFEMRASAEDGIDGVSRVTLLLNNADSLMSQIDRSIGFRGAKLTVAFVFANINAATSESAALTLFQGLADAPSESTEGSIRVTFVNRLSLHRVALPNVRIQRRCPWTFPSDAASRIEAHNGGERGRYSPVFACGYSPDQTGGVGNLDGQAPFTSCDYTRSSCMARGMFNQDSSGRNTARFGGIEFVPASTLVRGYSEGNYRPAAVQENLARYNDSVPLVYGTVWCHSPTVFAKNDGNVTRLEVLLGVGPIHAVKTVVVQGIEIPLGVDGRDMTGTGWFNVINLGERNGGFNLNFTDGAGQPLGDPYGSMAALSIVVPNRISDGRTLPRVEVLIEGLRLAQYDDAGTFTTEAFTNNPAWVLLDVLRRSGWELAELDVPSFSRAARACDEPVEAKGSDGESITTSRYQCNLEVRRRMSAGEVVRGIRNAAMLMLTYSAGGLLTVQVESTLAGQQPTLRSTSNAAGQIAGGWPAYEFSDGSDGGTGILRRRDGRPSIRLFSRSTAETPNRISVEFQDAFNGYQQDSFSITETEDRDLVRQEVTAQLPALGIANIDQAARLCRAYLLKSIFGNLYIEFESSMRAIGLWPGDIISVTYAKEGLARELFRVVKVAPQQNFSRVTIVAQVHDDDWYVPGATREQAARRSVSALLSLPRPLGGKVVDADGCPAFAVHEEILESGDGAATIVLNVEFTAPSRAVSSAVGVPHLSLSPRIVNNGGSLRGPDTLYYAICGLDSLGVQGELSFVVRAEIPAGENSRVILEDLSFSPGTDRFVVYRGPSPSELHQLGESMARSRTFTDSGGVMGTTVGPPDPNYSHANFYWRREIAPPVGASVWSATSIGSSSLELGTDELRGATVRIVKGSGVGQERRVEANDSSTVVVSRPWMTIPDHTSVFAIADSTWTFAGSTRAERVRLQVNNHPGAAVQILGLSANAKDQECPPEISIVTRYVVSGGAGNLLDAERPPIPTFGLASDGRGSIILGGVAFTALRHTRSIYGLTLTLHYVNEIQPRDHATLVLPVGADEAELSASETGGMSVGRILKVGTELCEVLTIGPSPGVITVRRGAVGTEPGPHIVGEQIKVLDRRVTMIPIAREFFGSPASGMWSHGVNLPGTLVVAAELFASNSRGQSDVSTVFLGGTLAGGLRTLQGGQTTMYVAGVLAIGAGAPGPLLGEAKVIRDLFAVVGEPPLMGALSLNVRCNDDVVATLEIQAGESMSNIIDGKDAPPLPELSRLTVDVTDVPPSGGGFPGRDLMVIVRH